MEFLQYSFAVILSSLGLIVGLLQAKISPEELKPGIKYYITLKKVLFLVMLCGLFYIVIKNLYIVIALMIALSLLLYKFDFDYIFIYPLFGLFLYIFSYDNKIFLAYSFLIFFIGFPLGTLIFLKDNKNIHISNLFISLGLFLGLTLPLFFSNF